MNYFSFQAGPVSMNTANRCIFAIGEIILPSGYHSTVTTTPNRTGRFCH